MTRPRRRLEVVGALLIVLSGAVVGALRLSEGGPPPGWRLTAGSVGLSGVGVDRRTLHEFQGPVRAGSTISLVKLTSEVNLSSLADVTLDRVWIAPVGGRRALVLGPGTVVKDSDVDGSAMQQGERIGIYGNVSGKYALSGVSITGMSVGAWLDGTGHGSVSETYIRAMTSLAGAHVDGFTRRAGTGPLSISRTRIDASGPDVTGAFFLQSTWGSRISGLTVKDCYLEGAGYVIRVENVGSSVPVRMKDVKVRSTGWGPLFSAAGVALTGWSSVPHDRPR